ncbi:wax ester/triacylglycerol synthase family O-acyltransferase [Ferrimonas kyonanensis]|uniref:wax ester/triacylglycerol synthase family O-acyltransferase n=1 Tax=Ferrimonas kyonanensis TaxID=364763 RepID=UPI0004281B97|nr:wax ester/triacylglycerol synthase family O-acyltransferase [Ferrimonas kyonanensis]
MQTMNFMDSMFFFVESAQTPMHVTPLLVLQPDAEHREGFALTLYRKLQGKTDVVAPFNWRPRFSLTGKHRWQEVAVDLGYHLRFAAVPAPGRQAQLNELICRIQSQPLDRTRPLWELYVIDGMSDGTVVLYLKLHHALFDGARINGYAQNMLTRSPDHSDWVPIWQHQVHAPRPDVPASGRLKTALESLDNTLTQARMLPQAIRLGARVVGGALGLVPSGAKTPLTAPRSILNTTPASGRSFATQQWSLARVKAIGKLTGASFNDIILTCGDMALQRYLKRNHSLPDKPLVVLMPMNVRQPGDMISNNQFVPGLVELQPPELLPLPRLRRIQSAARDTKNEIREFSPSLYEKYGVLIQAVSMIAAKYGLESKWPASSNLVISTVPGLEQTRYLMGAEVVQIAPMSALPPGQCLNISAYTYNGKVCLGLLGCRKVLPDIGLLASDMQRALDELELAALTQPKTSMFDRYLPHLVNKRVSLHPNQEGVILESRQPSGVR